MVATFPVAAAADGISPAAPPASVPAGQRDAGQRSAYQFLPYPAAEDESGFVPIFDGRSLAGWAGDPIYWRASGGSIVGETTPKTLLKDRNSFIVWRGGRVQDFELKLRYRISPHGNSGVNYRSEEMRDVAWTMRGYQFDVDGSATGTRNSQIMRERGLKLPSLSVPGEYVPPPSSARVSGNIYEERGRGILALAGSVGRAASETGARVLAPLGAPLAPDELTRAGWNDVHIVARGNVIMHLLNARLVSVLLDDDAAARRASGLIGLQVHVGPPMRVEYRDIRLKRTN